LPGSVRGSGASAVRTTDDVKKEFGKAESALAVFYTDIAVFYMVKVNAVML
jgi:hypothetical protein